MSEPFNRESTVLEPAFLWQWLQASEISSALLLVLPFLIAANLGAALASFVTWIEGHLTIAER